MCEVFLCSFFVLKHGTPLTLFFGALFLSVHNDCFDLRHTTTDMRLRPMLPFCVDIKLCPNVDAETRMNRFYQVTHETSNAFSTTQEGSSSTDAENRPLPPGWVAGDKKGAAAPAGGADFRFGAGGASTKDVKSATSATSATSAKGAKGAKGTKQDSVVCCASKKSIAHNAFASTQSIRKNQLGEGDVVDTADDGSHWISKFITKSGWDYWSYGGVALSVAVGMHVGVTHILEALSDQKFVSAAHSQVSLSTGNWW